jgi:DNA-binding NarL/FixJ family response regulator
MHIAILEADRLYADGLRAVFVARGHDVELVEPSEDLDSDPDVVLVSPAPGRTATAVRNAREVAPHAHVVAVLDPAVSEVDRDGADAEGAQTCVDAGTTLRELVARVEGANAPRAALLGARLPAPLPNLTPREHEVLEALVQGRGTAQLAATLGVTRATARSHVQHLLKKLGVHSRLEAVATAVRTGLVKVDLRRDEPVVMHPR